MDACACAIHHPTEVDKGPNMTGAYKCRCSDSGEIGEEIAKTCTFGAGFEFTTKFVPKLGFTNRITVITKLFA